MEKRKQDKSTSGKLIFIVTEEFRDADDYKCVYKVGDIVSHLNAERLEKLVSLGYVAQNTDDK